MSRESFPGIAGNAGVLAKLPLGTLAEMISRTIFAISSEESRFTLNGALLTAADSGLVMVATDGHRLSMVERRRRSRIWRRRSSVRCCRRRP